MTKPLQSQNNLDSRLKAVWLRGQVLTLASGLLVFCYWALTLFLVAVLIDWLINLPTVVRVLLLLSILGFAFYKAWRRGWRHARKFDPVHIALQLEKQNGGLDSLLVTAVQLAKPGAARGTSEAMRDQTCRMAEDAAKPLRPEDAVSYQGLRHPSLNAVIPIVFIIVTALINGPFMAAGASRIFAPWLSVDYPTRTQLELGNGNLIVKEASPAVIKAAISGVIPKQAKLHLRTGKGKPRVHKLPIAKDGACEYAIASAYRGFEYRVIAGDARSDWYKVEVITSPHIARADVSLEFPTYTERPTETVEALTVTVPEETRIQWQLTLDRPVSEAKFTPAGGSSLPLKLSSDGLVVSMDQVAKDSRAYNFTWMEKEHGFSFTSPSHYLQVAPDQPPRVELTSPDNDLYATIGRKLDLAFRGSDDHGIGKSTVAYRVNKIEEAKVPFSAPNLSEGGEHAIDWDYRNVLPNLEIGDNVSFVVELTDRYPGPDGPHLVRSQARRITFLSKEDYLARVEKQKKRLLYQLRSIYREERKVHATVSKLDPSSDVFVQSCQLEAVRQDLMKERLFDLKGRMDALLADLMANNITDESETAAFVKLSKDLQTIGDEHLSRAATSLRNLAAAPAPQAPQRAARMVNNVARELAIQLLQLGYREATEVMARELHVVAESQAYLRLQTIVSDTESAATATSQDELGQWLNRLLEATPNQKETTVKDALIAFTLTRLTKELMRDGVDKNMAKSVALIREPQPTEAAMLQADVIRALLKAEFRLRLGSEYEALDRARELFAAQTAGLQKLRTGIDSLDAEQFKNRRAELSSTQTQIRQNLHLLLMPHIPAPRARLFDAEVPAMPPVDELLAAAETAMEQATTHIDTGEQELVKTKQTEAEQSFNELAQIVNERIWTLAERERARLQGGFASARISEISLFVERQLLLLEKTEDAAADKLKTENLAGGEQVLARDLQKFRGKIEQQNQELGILGEGEKDPLIGFLDHTIGLMTSSIKPLNKNQPDDAIDLQDMAVVALEGATDLLTQLAANHGFLGTSLTDNWSARMPAPFVAEIKSEQLDLLKAVAKAEKDDLPGLAMTQRNLVHAVNAILEKLDPLAHKIESGTTMLFAKEDMDAASIAIEENDLIEAEDAGSFVAETMGDLYKDLEKVAPQYTYMLEVSEYFHEIVSRGLAIHAGQKQLIEKALAAPEGDEALRELIAEQGNLEAQAKDITSKYLQATGHDRLGQISKFLVAASAQLKKGERDEAIGEMEEAEAELGIVLEDLLKLMEQLSALLKPIVPPEAHSPEVAMLLDVLALASEQKGIYRKTQAANPQEVKPFAANQQEFAKRIDKYIEISKNRGEPVSDIESDEPAPPPTSSAPKPPHSDLVAARKSMLAAAESLQKPNGSANAINNQREAGDSLRKFIIDYVFSYVIPPVPAASDEAAPSDATESPEEDSFTIYMPGQLSGTRPKGGRLEWQVLGSRERAALNENFARELPLEYREILKDYYERLAR